jgi:hypothetical protein
MEKSIESHAGLTRKHGGREAKNLLDICEQAFDKSLRNIGNSIVANVRDEVHQVLAGFKNDVTGSRKDILSLHTSTRTVLDDLQKQTTDSTKVLQQLRLDGERSQQALMQRIARVEEDMDGLRKSQDCAGIDISKKVRDEVHEELQDTVRNSEASLKEVTQMQQELSMLSTQMTDGLLTMCSKDFINECFDRHLVALNVDKNFVQVSNQLEHTQELVVGLEGNLNGMTQEISFVQQSLVEKFTHYMSEIATEIKSLQQTQEQAENSLLQQAQSSAKTWELMRNSAAQLTDLWHYLQEIHRLQKDSTGQLSDTLGAQLDIRLGDFGADKPLHVTMEKVEAQIVQTHRFLHHDFTDLITEIGKVQQALNVDFVQIIREFEGELASRITVHEDRMKQAEEQTLPNVPMHPSGGSHAMRRTAACKPSREDGGTHATKRRPGSATKAIPFGEVETGAHPKRAVKRLREFWTQTDTGESADMSCQTEERSAPSKANATHHGRIKRRNRAKSIMHSQQKPFLAPVAPPKIKQFYADAEKMKRNARKNLIKQPHNVTDYYHKTGFFQAVAKSRAFDNVTFFFIFVNAFWISIDADYNDALLLPDAEPQFIVMENIFCGFFTLELFIRFMSFETKRNCLKDLWFCFDTILVLLMVMETWALTLFVILAGGNSVINLGGLSMIRIVRIVKMLRVSRMARLLRAIPEVVILVKGIGAASRSVLVFCTLWGMIIYVFAVVFKEFTDGLPTGQMRFETVWTAANTLLLNGVFPAHANIVNDVSEAHWTLWVVMMIFLLLASLTLLNMLVGVMVDIISVIATTEKESLVVINVAASLRRHMVKTGRDIHTNLDKKEFEDMICDPGVALVAQDCGVDLIALGDTADVIFEDLDKNGESMSFETFVNVFLNMRGTNPATVKDVKEQMRTMKGIVTDKLQSMEAGIQEEFHTFRQELYEREKERMEHQRAILEAMEEDDEESEEDVYAENSSSDLLSASQSHVISGSQIFRMSLM